MGKSYTGILLLPLYETKHERWEMETFPKVVGERNDQVQNGTKNP